MKHRLDTKRQKKDYLKQELDKQLDLQARQKEAERAREKDIDRLSIDPICTHSPIELENMAREFRVELETTKRAEKASYQACAEVNNRQLKYQHIASRLDDSNIVPKIQ